ncbi:MAG: glycosyltransferase [Herbinix sp.]|nr:glycosyltransferase [Herbinix sp.]
MQSIMRMLASEIIFWTAWIIIPLIMEIIPATFGFLVLLKKQNKYSKDPNLKYFPEISVIVPVYNSADTLEMCICSIMESKYPADKIEVLLVNNGSRDNSFEIFQRYQETHPGNNLKWMNARQGKSKALNMALFNSKGKYIIHLDSDGVLHQDALLNLITRFEAHDDIHCMTGSILTNPQAINSSNRGLMKIIKKVEFFEYAQAFLAGRNFEAEWNNIFTMSGAFSAFRKSTILKTQLYNTETVCEDTHVTFQVRHLLKKKIDICERAIFFVDPIPSLDTLYVQRQRWQRGEIEVAHMFPQKIGAIKGFFTDMMTRLIMFDHTFAFPRMIWYFALICLAFMNYPFSFVIESVIIIYILYTISTFLYYLNVCHYLKWDKELKNFYQRKIIYVVILPIFNFIVYWFRMAGIINSIKGVSTWKTKTFKEEREQCRAIVINDFRVIGRILHTVKLFISSDK